MIYGTVTKPRGHFWSPGKGIIVQLVRHFAALKRLGCSISSIFTGTILLLMCRSLHWDPCWDDGQGVGAPFEIIPRHPEEAIEFAARLQFLRNVLVSRPLIT